MYLATGVRWDLGEFKEFKSFIKEVNSTVTIPSGKTVSKYAETRFNKMKKDMIDVLANSNRTTVTTDMWSSFNCREAFIGTVPDLPNCQGELLFPLREEKNNKGC